MPRPKRPHTVPPDATWDADRQQWQLGPGRTVQHKFPTGQWRYWRLDGSIARIANYDDEGLQNGITEEFHEDGTVAIHEEWSQGCRCGLFFVTQSKNQTSVPYYEDERTWRHEWRHLSDFNTTDDCWFLEDGTECTSSGVPIEQAYDLDELIERSEPSCFLLSTAQEIHSSLTRGDTSPLDSSEMEGLWGTSLDEVKNLLSVLIATKDFVPTKKWRTFLDEDNVWVSLINHHWDNEFEELAAVLMGAVQIGRVADSTGIYATLFRQFLTPPSPNIIYQWSHELYYIDEVLTKTFDDFAYRVAISGAHERQRISGRQANAAWKKLAERTYVEWSIAQGFECHQENYEQFRSGLDAANELRSDFWRAQWILCLLEPDEKRNWEDVQESFRENFNPVLGEKEHSEWLEIGHRIPQTAIYLLWRNFWFGDTQRLAACCDTYRTHCARLVRDLVKMLEAVDVDETHFENIHDIKAVREKFLNQRV